MKYFDIPLFVLFVSASYLCVVYFGLGLVKRWGVPRRKDKSLDAPKTVHPSSLFD